MIKKEFDVIVFGATSFVGQILVQYLWKRHGLKGEVKWAIAGRDSDKLKVLKNKLGEQAQALPTLVANAGQDQTPAVTEWVTLDGGGSSDVDGDPLTITAIITPQGTFPISVGSPP